MDTSPPDRSNQFSAFLSARMEMEPEPGEPCINIISQVEHKWAKYVIHT